MKCAWPKCSDICGPHFPSEKQDPLIVIWEIRSICHFSRSIFFNRETKVILQKNSFVVPAYKLKLRGIDHSYLKN